MCGKLTCFAATNRKGEQQIVIIVVDCQRSGELRGRKSRRISHFIISAFRLDQLSDRPPLLDLNSRRSHVPFALACSLARALLAKHV